MAGGTNLFTQLTSTLWVALTQAENSVGTDQLALLAKCTGTPPTTAGLFAPGCIMIQTDAGSGNEGQWTNTGTSAAPVWSLLTGGTGGTTYGMVAKQTNGLTDTNVFGGNVPFGLTLTGVWEVSKDDTNASVSLVSTAGTIATMQKGTMGAMVGSAIANTALTTGNSLVVRSSSATGNATVFMSFLA